MLFSIYVERKKALNIHKTFNYIKEAYAELIRFWHLRMPPLWLCCDQILIPFWNEWAEQREKNRNPGKAIFKEAEDLVDVNIYG